MEQEQLVPPPPPTGKKKILAGGGGGGAWGHIPLHKKKIMLNANQMEQGQLVPPPPPTENKNPSWGGGGLGAHSPPQKKKIMLNANQMEQGQLPLKKILARPLFYHLTFLQCIILTWSATVRAWDETLWQHGLLVLRGISQAEVTVVVSFRSTFGLCFWNRCNNDKYEIIIIAHIYLSHNNDQVDSLCMHLT